ncbi:hypothetical protein LTR37_016635 [Vermiconidia calcicola]|uniref:Uncharacterized protein n=1 Tax=Vermiconidia calcicola TaxID=1690605 RepID=A0ACC3MMA8_9PEZI|nr:hypothetical protein LTR37_016635 [Vermiconidia calcicola]
MTFLRRTWVLTQKDLKIVALKRWPSTLLRALALPIAYAIFIAYARNFFLPPSEYGFGSPRPIRDLTTEVFNSSTSLGGRDRIVFINNGLSGGEIDTLIDRLSSPLREVGADVRILPNEEDLVEVCQSSLSGVSTCFASASFRSSPTEGDGVWSYTARIDAGLGISVFVNQPNNAAQIYVLPFIQAIDAEIARMSGTSLPAEMLEQPFTYETIQDREDDVQQFFMSALSGYLAVTMFIAICGIAFHLPGYLAVEWETGLSTLVDIMSFDSRPWVTLTTRLTSSYFAFVAIYLPGWLSIGAIVSQLIFTRTSAAIVIPFHLLIGLSLTGYALFVGSWFKKAQLSGITGLIIALALAVVAQFAPRTSTSIAALSVIFPPATYTFWAIQVAEWEVQLEAAQLNSDTPTYPPWNTPGHAFFIFLAVQIIAYPVLAALVQWLLHATSRANRSVLEERHIALRLVGVSRIFKRGWLKTLFRRSDAVVAVDNLSLDIARGQLVTLLGVNGSGKSTLLAGVTGTQSLSKGNIELPAGSKTGFCPQSNVAWDDLTVFENVITFAKLKAGNDVVKSNEVKALISACDLAHKTDKKPRTLSGGQKRKLQLAMAFIGGSSICCVDEVSSGLDPLSRRKIWEILLAERGTRTIILTTHALDEADAISDHIAIMSHGRLIAEGSTAEVKEKYGGGYQIFAPFDQVLPTLTDVEDQGQSGDHPLQAADLPALRQVVDRLEKDGRPDYSVQCPTIEHAFLSLAKREKQSRDDYSTESRLDSPLSESRSRLKPQDRNAAQEEQYASERGNGTSFFQQTGILFMKRLLIFRRNYMLYICAIAVPAIVAGLGGYYFLYDFNGIPCTLGAIANDPQRLSLGALERYWGVLVPVGPPERFALSSLPPAYRAFRNQLSIVDNLPEFNSYIRNNFRDVAPGGFYLGDNATSPPLMAYRINGNPGYSALAKNLADSYLTGVTINADFSTFALPFTGSTGDSLQAVLYISLALSTYPAFFALYPTFERLANVRALHYSGGGVRPVSLWLAYLLFDGIIVLLTSVVVIALLTSATDVWYAPGYVFVAIFLYGICSTLLAYVVSLFSKTQLAAFAIVAGFQAVSMLIYFILYLLLLTFGSAEQLQRNLNVVQYTYGFISPSGSLLRVMLLALNQSQLLCRTRSLVSYPGDITVYGAPILYFILQSVAMYAILVCHDSYSLASIFDWRRATSKTEDVEKDHNPSNISSLEKKDDTRPSIDGLQLRNLSKRSGRETVVDDVTFGVNKGEIFALLGKNGAGKTTTLGLIRGSNKPSSSLSEVLIAGHSITSDKLAAQQHLGVCPQFNALDRVTVTEHLKFYARVRGIRHVSQKVDAALRAFGLYEYRKRFTAQLSGGNQRKLSLATAMIGNPSVVLLDEPSTGMDALAMRQMWQVISGMNQDVAVVITTHSMEEANVLSDRVAIMDKRILTIGSPSELRDRYAAGTYQLHVVHSKGLETSGADMEKILAWIVESCPRAKVQRSPEQELHGQLRCQIVVDEKNDQNGERHSSSAHDYLVLLELMEESKERFGVEYYSIARPTLEDVFLDILEKHR